MRWLGAFFIFFSTIAVAGGVDTGNGGNIVACSGQIQTKPIFSKHVTVLDLLEGVHMGFTYRHLAELRPLQFEDAFEKALNIFFKPQGVNIRLYESWFRHFNEDTIFSRGTLPLRFRGSQAVDHYGCLVAQAVLQMAPRDGHCNAPVLFASPSIWDDLPSDLKVALLLHEYLLHTPALQYSCSAFQVRNILAYLLSDQAFENVKHQKFYYKRAGCPLPIEGQGI